MGGDLKAEGKLAEKGQVMYRLDRRQAQAAVEQAERLSLSCHCQLFDALTASCD